MFGMPTLLDLDSLEAQVALAGRLGLSFVEINLDLPDYGPEALSATALAKLRRETGVGFTLHLPERLDLAAFQTLYRHGCLACAIDALRWAGDAGIGLVNLHLHPGVYFTLPERRAWLYERHREAFLRHLTESFSVLLSEARARGIAVCVENCGQWGQGFLREAVEALLALPGGGVRLTWDVGHDAAHGGSETAFFLAHEAQIGHLHLHDCVGSSNHLPLFTGVVDIAGHVARARRLGVRAVIETKTVIALEESVGKLQARGILDARRRQV